MPRTVQQPCRRRKEDTNSQIPGCESSKDRQGPVYPALLFGRRQVELIICCCFSLHIPGSIRVSKRVSGFRALRNLRGQLINGTLTPAIARTAMQPDNKMMRRVALSVN